MRKFICLFLAAIIALCVCSCGKADTPAATAESEKSSGAAAQPFKAGVWSIISNGEETATYTFTENMKECLWSAGTSGVGFDYEIDGDTYVFHLGSSDDVTKAKAIFSDEDNCVLYWEDSGAENTLKYKGTVEEVSAAETLNQFPRLIINSEPFCVEVKDGFESAGVSSYICDASEEYSFKSSSPDVTWDIYILDEPFEDGARFLSQAREPDLSGDGTLKIDEGKYVYVKCSENGFTSDGESMSDAVLSIDYAS